MTLITLPKDCRSYRAYRDRTRDDAFTLIELLVVVIIIAILAAIAIPTYLFLQSGAHAASVKSDAANVATEVGTGQATGTIGTTLADLQTAQTNGKLTVSSGNTLLFASDTSGTNYICVENTSENVAAVRDLTSSGSAVASGTGDCETVLTASSDSAATAAVSAGLSFSASGSNTSSGTNSSVYTDTAGCYYLSDDTRTYHSAWGVGQSEDYSSLAASIADDSRNIFPAGEAACETDFNAGMAMSSEPNVSDTVGETAEITPFYDGALWGAAAKRYYEQNCVVASTGVDCDYGIKWGSNWTGVDLEEYKAAFMSAYSDTITYPSGLNDSEKAGYEIGKAYSRYGLTGCSVVDGHFSVSCGDDYNNSIRNDYTYPYSSSELSDFAAGFEAGYSGN